MHADVTLMHPCIFAYHTAIGTRRISVIMLLFLMYEIPLTNTTSLLYHKRKILIDIGIERRPCLIPVVVMLKNQINHTRKNCDLPRQR